MDHPAPDAPDPVGRLLRLLDLDDLGGDRFGVDNPDRGFGPRVFGGQVAAQALRAAQATVDVDHAVHSLHAYFLRPGVPGVPITYAVDRIRDGRSFTTRTVVARQGDDAIFEQSVSFHRREGGADYQRPIATDVPGPEEVPDAGGPFPDAVRPLIPVEMRELGPTPADADGFHSSTRRAWMRLKRRVPDDPAVHEALLAFLSDMGAMVGARAPLPSQPLDRLMGASLDHAMWFHRPMRADEWFLYDLTALSNAGSRGLAVGTMHTGAGVLGVSVAQEALLRVIDRQATSLADPPPDPPAT